VTDVATFVSVSIIGGAVIQYPLGYRSDRRDRRFVIIGTTAAGLAAALVLGTMAGGGALANFVLVFVFGAFCMPLYSLFAAHANDHATTDEFVLVNAALMLFYSFGAIVGPFAIAYAMEIAGPPALFLAIAVVYALLIAVILYRMRARPAAPRETRGRFTAMLRTSPVFARLAKRSGTRKAKAPNRTLLSQGETD
jgi:MFS family permease